MSQYAKVIADSVSAAGKRIVTLELCYQRFIHAEVKTHRVLSKNPEELIVQEADIGFMSDTNFSRNAMSSRAIPVAKMIEQVRENPAAPLHWGANQPGMQAHAQLEGDALLGVQRMWAEAAMEAARIADIMTRYGAHKQVANRILEPFQWMRTIVTATEWDNFFELRDHPDAQPEFQNLARLMREAMAASEPVLRRPLEHWEKATESSWHLPYVTADERRLVSVELLPKISAARCARVSYLTHEGENPDIVKDLQLFERLVGSTPLHASPIEHQALPLHFDTAASRNFQGWQQYREKYESNLKGRDAPL